MNLGDYKLVFIALGLVGVLLIASPSIAQVIEFPPGEQFSELYLLGPGRMAQDFPYNIVPGQTYSFYAGVTNHLGSSAYYVLEVKLRNQTDSYPNATTGTPSSLPTLYEAHFALPDNQTWETPITFTANSATTSETQATVQTLTINTAVFNVNKPAQWDTNSTSFPYQLLFELWLYNPTTGKTEYNSRHVHLWLNITATP
jgi:uncharacterized membrane protein